MKNFIRFLFLFLIAAFIPFEIKGQNYQNIRLELQKKQENARSDIQSLRRQIIGFQERVSQASDAYTQNYEQVKNLQREITLRNAVIRTLEEEGASIRGELEVTRKQINDLTEDLNTLIENYKSALRYLYKHGRTPDEAILYASGSVNQMLVRSYYLERFDQFRKNQAEQISSLREKLASREEELQDARQRNQNNIREIRNERHRLEEREKEQKQKTALLLRDRDRLEQRLSATKREAQSLESTLSTLIEEEARIRVAEQERLERLEQERLRRLASAANIRSRREREAQVERFSRPVEVSELPSQEALKKLENSFEEKKGNLPWPVSTGTISARFGNRVNPVYGTNIDHPGIEIITEPRSVVRSVHEGYVFAVQPISGFGNCVFLKHGRYITVYGNLSDISVSRNSYVHQGDIIGRSGDEDSLKGAALFFMIRDQNTNLDPEIWITSR